MRGLVYKDLMTIAHELHRVALFMLIAVFGAPVMLALTSGEMEQIHSMPMMMCPVVGMVMINNTFGYDEKSGWMQYAFTNPVSRVQYYHAKFLTHAVNVCTGSLLGLVVGILLASVTGQMTLTLLGDMAAETLLTAGSLFLVGFAIIPLFLKFGAQKGAMMLMLVFLGVAAGCFVLVTLCTAANESTSLWIYVLLGVILLGSIITFYLLGRKWVKEKEF